MGVSPQELNAVKELTRSIKELTRALEHQNNLTIETTRLSMKMAEKLVPTEGDGS